MVKAVPTLNCNTFPNQGSPSTGLTYKTIMLECEKMYQGIYFEVHVECSDPAVPIVKPFVLKSARNQPEEYTGPMSGKTKFEFQVEQYEKCKEVRDFLYERALGVQARLCEQYDHMTDEFQVIITERKLELDSN